MLALVLAKSTEESLLGFMSRNSNSDGRRNFKYSIFLSGMKNLRPLIGNNLSQSVR